MFISLSIVFIWIVIMYILRATADSSKVSNKVPSKFKKITVGFDKDKTMNEILNYANNNKIKIGYTNLPEGKIVLDDDFSFWGNSCHYPVFVNGTGVKTDVTIGICSKDLHHSTFWGAQRKLDYIVNSIQSHFDVLHAQSVSA